MGAAFFTNKHLALYPYTTKLLSKHLIQALAQQHLGLSVMIMRNRRHDRYAAKRKRQSSETDLLWRGNRTLRLRPQSILDVYPSTCNRKK
jgi:hypothetical protein